MVYVHFEKANPHFFTSPDYTGVSYHPSYLLWHDNVNAHLRAAANVFIRNAVNRGVGFDSVLQRDDLGTIGYYLGAFSLMQLSIYEQAGYGVVSVNKKIPENPLKVIPWYFTIEYYLQLQDDFNPEQKLALLNKLLIDFNEGERYPWRDAEIVVEHSLLKALFDQIEQLKSNQLNQAAALLSAFVQQYGERIYRVRPSVISYELRSRRQMSGLSYSRALVTLGLLNTISGENLEYNPYFRRGLRMYYESVAASGNVSSHIATVGFAVSLLAPMIDYLNMSVSASPEWISKFELLGLGMSVSGILYATKACQESHSIGDTLMFRESGVHGIQDHPYKTGKALAGLGFLMTILPAYLYQGGHFTMAFWPLWQWIVMQYADHEYAAMQDTVEKLKFGHFLKKRIKRSAWYRIQRIYYELIHHKKK